MLLRSLLTGLLLFPLLAWSQYPLIDQHVVDSMTEKYAYYSCSAPVRASRGDSSFTNYIVGSWKYSDINFAVAYRAQRLIEYCFRAPVNMYQQEMPDLLQAKLCTKLNAGQDVTIEIPFVSTDRSPQLFKKFKIDIWLSDTFVKNTLDLHKARKGMAFHARPKIQNDTLKHTLIAQGGEQYINVVISYRWRRIWGSVRFTEPSVETASQNHCRRDSMIVDADDLTYSIPSHLLFEFDSDELLPGAEEVISKIMWANRTRDSVLILGYTDTIGMTEYNLNLSQKRADRVAMYFLFNSDIQGVQSSGMGECIEPKHTLEQCRRVEIVFW